MKKLNFRKLKFNMWSYFLIFTVIIISLIWVFQLIFLEGYYRNTKISTMKRYGDIIIRSAETSVDIDESVRECKDMGINVYIFSDNAQINGGNENYVLYSSTEEKNPDMFMYAADNLVKSGSYEYSGIFRRPKNSEKTSDDIFYIAKINYKSNSSYLLLSSTTANLTETVKVIRFQLLTITIIIIIISFVLAWYFSGKLSRPIDDMSLTAKRWADGDNSVTFKAKNSYTEITELADALNYAKDGVSKSGELQRDLLANVSHDLKTPLTMIKAYAEMIKDISGDNKEKREKHTQVIIDEADRLTMLVNDILNLSKLQSSVDDLTFSEINLSELTERVIGRFSDYIENQGYKIEEHIAPDLITVADEKKVEQVIYNLLGNSINYTGEDKTVKVYLTAENDKILLEIIDSGKGISEEKLATIWERYYRFSETNTRPVKGTGLGLSIVKAILDNHKLKFGVRSKENCGSNFYVEFNRVRNE